MANAPLPPVWPEQAQPVATVLGQPRGFWIRFAAYAIDGVILLMGAVVLSGALLISVFGSVGEDERTAEIAFMAALVPALIVMSWLYEALLTSSPSGATLGKQVAGLRICRTDGGTLSFGRASARHFVKCYATPLVPLAFGYIMVAFTGRKQALHDLVASTLVVDAVAHRQDDVVVETKGASVDYAGFWLRAAGGLIDLIVILVAAVAVGAVIGMTLGAIAPIHAPRSVGIVIVVVLSWLYFAFLESTSHSATLGKVAVGLKVVTAQGQRLSFGRATARYLCKYVSGAMLGGGFIMAAFTDRKRGLHDMIAGTVVVRTR